MQTVKKHKNKQKVAFGSLYQATYSKERLTKSNTADPPADSRLPRYVFQHKRSDSYTEAVYSPKPSEAANEDVTATAASFIPTLSRPSQRSNSVDSLDSDDSVESVEADNVRTSHEPRSSPAEPSSEPETDRSPVAMSQESATVAADGEVYDQVGASFMGDEADRTLTGAGDNDDGADDYDAVDHSLTASKSPRKLSRSRVVTGSKPTVNIHIRSESELSDGKTAYCWSVLQ